MLRLLHTSDWHLGHVLRDFGRELEHDHFLSWLLSTLVERDVDALLIAGDVFDNANPSADAQRRFFGFLAEARRRLPALQFVVIAGNHDSGARIDAPEPVLTSLGMHVVGALPPLEKEGWQGRVLLPLKARSGEVAAWVAAVPFLRASDLPAQAAEAGDALIESVRQVYTRVLDACRERRKPGQAMVALGHLYMVGTALSGVSERKILGGNQHALPHDLFPEDVAYVALGHLHKAQQVGRNGVRYCGSPFCLDFSEAPYAHQVCVVELEGEALKSVECVPVPRLVPMLRIPDTGHLPLSELLKRLEGLPRLEAASQTSPRPFLEVYVSLDGPEPSLHEKIHQEMEGCLARLLRINIRESGVTGALGDGEGTVDLQDLQPQEVFGRLHLREHGTEASAPLLAAFHELLETTKQEAGA